MYEPITIVKVRKETKITVPAGGWVLIGQPDEPLHKQLERRAALMKDGPVNDDYAALIIGRVSATNPNTAFLTTAEAKAGAKAAADREAALAKNISDAKTRQKKQAEDNSAAEKKAHEEKVAAINAENDAIRNRGAK